MGQLERQSSSRNGTTQAVAYTGTSATCANPFGSATYQIRIASTSACNYRVVDASGAALTTDAFLPNNWVEYVTVQPGQKISAIQASSNGLVTATAGTLFVTEVS